MYLIGLIGNMGCGKSTIANKLSNLFSDILVVNTDNIAKEIMNYLGYDIEQVKQTFFKDKELQKKIEKEVHPLVWKHIKGVQDTHPKVKYLIIESAILFESKWDYYMDKVFVITSNDNRARIMSSRNMAIEQVVERLDKQLPESELIARADVVITNNNDQLIDDVVWYTSKVLNTIKPNKKVVYAGTFDPITLGHIDVIEAVSKMFDKIIISIGTNIKKSPMFDIELRMKMIEEALKEKKIYNTVVIPYDGLTVNLAKETRSVGLVRGLRLVTDYEEELDISFNNTHLGRVQTILIPPKQEHIHIRSSTVREIIKFDKTLGLEKYLPGSVIKLMNESTK